MAESGAAVCQATSNLWHVSQTKASLAVKSLTVSREMRRRLAAFVKLCLAACALAGPISASAADTAASRSQSQPAAPPVHARFAVHKDFDRLVLKLPVAANAVFRQDGVVLRLSFAGAGRLTGNVAGQRILSMSRIQSEAVFRLAPDTRVRSWRSGDMLIFDVFGPRAVIGTGSSTPGEATRPGFSANAGGGSTPKMTETPAKPSPAGIDTTKAGIAARAAETAPTLVQIKLPPRPVAQTLSSPVLFSGRTEHGAATEAPAAISNPASIMMLRDATAADPTLLVPFGRNVGAAAFSRGNDGRVIFDVPQYFDLSGLKDDPVFGTLTERLLPDGMELSVNLGAASGLRLLRRDDGWAISLQSSVQPSLQLSPIVGRNGKGATIFDVNAAGRVVVVNDDLTGGRLLIGTQRTQGQHVGSVHLSAEAAILPTSQGVVVQPSSDRVLLRATQAGFELSSIDSTPLAMTWSDQQTGTWPDGRFMTRLFDFPNASPESLDRMLGQALEDAAETPKLARFVPRVRVAQAMLAQGMDVEAVAVLRTAQADDPTSHDGPCAACLDALASWMSARAGGIEAPDTPAGSVKFGDSDEAAFWKTLLRQGSADVAERAAVVASTWPLLLSYSPMLRRFALEPVAALLFEGGQTKALSAFLAAFPNASLDMARANLLRSQGKIDDCLKLYDQVAVGRDRLARANALEQAVLVRLASNRMSAASAAEALNGQLYAWRGGARELRLRQRVAQLRAQAGQWRAALTMLNETDETSPQAHANVKAAKSALVAELLRGDNLAKLNALDLVAIADGTSDVLDGNNVGFAPAMVDKLLALDLPGRADAILHRLFERANDPKTKAELGLRLAATMLDGDDPSAALEVLAASDDAELGAEITSRRTLLRARLLARSGKPADALEALNGVHSRDASDLQATILEGQHEWTHASGVLKPLVFDSEFKAMPQAVQRDLVLRLARDEVEAGDQAGLHVLRQAEAAQFQAGPNERLFAVLTAEPILSTADLPRSAAEVSALRSVPAFIAQARP